MLNQDRVSSLPSQPQIATRAGVIRATAATLIARGGAVCLVHPNEKRPTYAEWGTKSKQAVDFGPEDNLGIVCGPISAAAGHSLVCIDLDTAAVLARADEFLPLTGMTDGRKGKPRSHRWYLVPNDSVPAWAESTAPQAATVAREKYGHPGPWKKGFDGPDGERPIDFIGTGGQANVPPSIHGGTGEVRQWEGGEPGQPAVVEFMTLWRATCDLANAAGCRVPKGNRQRTPAGEKATVLARRGGMLSSTPSCEEDDAFNYENAHATKNPEAEKRAAAYLRAMPLPRTGQGGDGRTFRALGVMLYGFALNRKQAIDVFTREVNSRLSGVGDEWSADEIERKVDILIARGPDEENYGPVGSKLTPTTGAPAAWNDADRQAGDFVKDHPGAAIRNTVALYDGGCYRVCSDEWLNKQVRAHLTDARDREQQRRVKEREDAMARLDAVIDAPDLPTSAPKDDCDQQRAAKDSAQKEKAKLEKTKLAAPESVGTRLVAEVVAAVRAKWQLPDNTQPNTWLRGDGPAHCMSVANGLYDLDTNTLLPHSSDFLAFTQIAAPYDPSAPKPERFLRVLHELLEGDADRVAVVQEIFGACLDPKLTIKFFFAFVGLTNNGKSVVIAVLRAMLGEANVSSQTLEQLAARFGTWPLLGKLLNAIGDQSAVELEETGWLKTLTGGDLIGFEQKGRDPIYAPNTAKIGFSCNEMPPLKDRTDATWGRMVAVPFNYAVPAEKKNSAFLLPETWNNELPGILNWALEGLARLRAKGQFTRSAECEKLKAEYRTLSDPARTFLLEHYEAGSDGDAVTASQLYQQYETWAAANGLKHPLASIPFGRSVGRVFPNARNSAEWEGAGKDRTKVRRWRSLRLREGMGKSLGVAETTYMERMEQIGSDRGMASVPS